MTRKSKALVVVAVALVVVNAVVFTYLFLDKKSDELETQLVQEEKEKKVPENIKSDLIQAKITKIGDGEIEYETIMMGVKEIEKEKRQTKTSKINDETKVYVLCETLSLKEWVAEVGDIKEGENPDVAQKNALSEGDGERFKEREPDQKCLAVVSDLSEGDLVNMKIKDGTVSVIK